MCWDMIIEHQNDACFTNADYFPWLDANLCFNPLLKEYIQQAHVLCCQSPAPSDMTIAPEFQPYFRGPCINSPQSPPPPECLTMHANVATIPATAGLQHLQNLPVSFGRFPQSLVTSDVALHCLYNFKLTQAASMLAHFDWAIYGFDSGHFLLMIKEHGYPFHVVLACNPFVK
jgi:hypothetical protein